MTALRAALPLLLAAACAAPGPPDGPARVHRGAEGALGPYSGSVAVPAGRDLVFASGKIGAEREGSFEAEAEGAIDAVAGELARAGLGLGDVVSVTVHLTDIELYGAFNAVYARRFPAPYPARTCVAVTALPGGARVEVTAIASR